MKFTVNGGVAKEVNSTRTTNTSMTLRSMALLLTVIQKVMFIKELGELLAIYLEGD
jgi:hypothetical protein